LIERHVQSIDDDNSTASRRHDAQNVGAVANHTPNVDGALAATLMQPGKEIEENASMKAFNPATTLAEPAEPRKAKERVKIDIRQTPIRDLPVDRQKKIAIMALNVWNHSIQRCLRKKNISVFFSRVVSLKEKRRFAFFRYLGTVVPRFSPRTDLVDTIVPTRRS
jgi:hypothetical protein